MAKQSAVAHRLPAAGAAGQSREPGLAQAIEAMIGPIQFVDLSFPRCVSPYLVNAEVTQVHLGQGSVLEQDFLARFRQAGGHHPIVVAEQMEGEPAWPPLALDAGLRGRTLVAVFERPDDAASLALRLRDEATCLVVPFPHDRPGRNAFPSGEFSGFRPVLLKHATGGTSSILMVPDDLPVKQPAGGALLTFTDENAQALTLPARSLVHDGGFASEGDPHYSWLWTGPDSSFRFIVPSAPAMRARSLDISVIRTEDGRNLDELSVQLDGRSIAHDLTRWSDNSGKIVIELPPSRDYRVVTLAVPRMVADGNSGRMLGLCIDKIVVSPA
jgi:hypothetical protein